MKSFTVAFVTGREQDQWPWLRDSLRREFDRFGLLGDPRIVIVTPYLAAKERRTTAGGWLETAQPKPTIWQGKHRITKENWWAAANARNTAICLCATEWICFFDDRCVLMPGYLDALSNAMDGNYALAGGYQKRTGITVEDGVIRHAGTVIGSDTRKEYVEKNVITDPFPCPGSWLFGANFACPLEWLLAINGVPEICDGQGFEDVQTGLLLEHNGCPIKYDTRAFVVEDRTPGECGPAYRREDKGVSPNDKSHALLARFNHPGARQAIHTPGFSFDIRQVRRDVLSGKPWPTPPEKDYFDWYDNSLINGI